MVEIVKIPKEKRVYLFNKMKPEHNQFDNIYELRMKNDYGQRTLAEILEGRRPLLVDEIELRPSKRIVDHRTPESFIGRILRLGRFKHPLWKVVCPRPRGETGAIYYIVDAIDTVHIFRGTYGYMGTGPHQSALIEEFMETHGLRLELRDGDYLLTLIGLR